MKVKILTHTKDPERTIATAAKLCYSNSTIDDLFNNQSDETIEKFIEKLSNMGHESPLEHVSFTFSVEGVSRILEQQLTRHRIASYSIRSGRYTTRKNANFHMSKTILNNDVVKDIYEQSTSYAKDSYDNMLKELTVASIKKECSKDILDTTNMTNDEIIEKYIVLEPKKYAEFKKTATENARSILPNSLETNIIFTMNARELMHFFNHRCCNRAQEEIRELANKVLVLVKEICPTIFKKAGPPCKKLGYCKENNMQCKELKSYVPTHDKVLELIKIYYKGADKK